MFQLLGDLLRAAGFIAVCAVDSPLSLRLEVRQPPRAQRRRCGMSCPPLAAGSGPVVSGAMERDKANGMRPQRRERGHGPSRSSPQWCAAIHLYYWEVIQSLRWT